MRKKSIYFTLFIAFSLCLTACASPQKDGKDPLQAVMSQENLPQEALTQAKVEMRESTRDSGEEQEEKRSELVSALTKRISIGDSKKKRAAFAEWLLDTYGSEALEGMDFSKDIGRQLYDITGKSLHVLWDTSLGYLENEKKAAKHSVYLREAKGDGVDLAFAGDICLTEKGYVIDHYDRLGGNINSCLSKKILNRLNQADISMINHEYPASKHGKALKGKYYTFRAAPKREKILQQMGIDIVSLANNHIYDYGAKAFLDTLDTLKKAEIPYVGAGANRKEASKPVYFVAGGLKIGFVAANRSERIIFTPEAGKSSPGVVRMYQTAKMKKIIKKARKQCDYLIAYVHWGTEDSKYYEAYQTKIAREFFHSGADAIIGSHPHVLQGIRYVEGKPVVYSLGDFWFNGETKYTTIANLKVSIDGLEELSVLPCIQKGYETHYISKKSGQKAFYKYLRKLSPGVAVSEKGIVKKK